MHTIAISLGVVANWNPKEVTFIKMSLIKIYKSQREEFDYFN
jgi:hypothetical protein